MQVLEIVKSVRTATRISGKVVTPVLFLLLLLGTVGARAAAFYSGGAPVNTSTKQVCTLGCITLIDTEVTTPVGGVAISAAVNLPVAGATRLRYQLLNVNGTDLTGYRAGILLSTNSTLLGLNALSTITVRTYLSTGPTPTVAQQDFDQALRPGRNRVWRTAEHGHYRKRALCLRGGAQPGSPNHGPYF
jgi:hypothetical protein